MGQLPRVGRHLYCQCHYALGIYSISTETDKGRVKLVQSSWIKLQPLKSRKVDDIHGAIVVHEDPLGVESFYCEHYNQGVIMRLLHSSNILFRDKHVLIR